MIKKGIWLAGWLGVGLHVQKVSVLSPNQKLWVPSMYERHPIMSGMILHPGRGHRCSPISMLHVDVIFLRFYQKSG